MSPRTPDRPPRPPASLQRSAPVFSALADETRQHLLARLAGAPEPLSITRLTEGSDLTRQAITKHLRILEHAGLVRTERHGRESLFVIQPKPIEDARRALAEIAHQWGDALQRLKSFVETD